MVICQNPDNKKKSAGDGKPKEKRRDLQGTLAHVHAHIYLSLLRAYVENNIND